MRPIAILGGTFDPVHNGHLRVALEAAEELDADVRLMPSNVPPHRTAPVATAEQRVDFMRRALAGQSRLTLDARELDRDGPSYTVDTMLQLRAEFGPKRPLILLLGADAFGSLATWHAWRELFTLTHIAVLTRPSAPVAEPPVRDAALQAEWESRRARAPADLRAAPAGRIIELAVTALNISSSNIRARLIAGGDPRWLLPDALCKDKNILDVYRSKSSTNHR